MGAIGLFIAGLITGGGDVGRLFGADWAQVDWAAVATMLLIVGVLAVILIPLAYFVLPQRMKRVGAGFTALAVLAPGHPRCPHRPGHIQRPRRGLAAPRVAVHRTLD